jgi:hypothetical protein
MNRETRPPSAFSPPAKRRSRFTFTIGKMMRIIFVAACLFAFLTLVVRHQGGAYSASRRAQCTNNLKQIALALHNYHAAYDALPPAYIADERGRPLHSWRVLLLPFLEQQGLYDQYDFREPWDGPNNIKLLGKMPSVFECPSNYRPGPAVSTVTSYVVISGPGTMFPGASSILLDQVTDVLAETLMVVEAANVRIPWTKPEDLDLRTMGLHVNDRDYPSISSNHPGGASAAMGDATWCFVPESITAIRLRALVTIAGGETIPLNW